MRGLHARDLASEVNRLVARVQAAQRRLRGSTGAAADTLARVNVLAERLITPPVRYSRPGLQAHIAYLYGLLTTSDQRPGRDAIERYATLRRELDAAQAVATALLGPAPPGDPEVRNDPARDDDEDSENEES